MFPILLNSKTNCPNGVKTLTRPTGFSLAILIFACALISASAQDAKTIGFLLDGPWERNQEARNLVETRIERAVGPERVQFPSSKRLSGNWTRASVAAALDQLLADPEVDLVITLGMLSSHEAVARSSLPKPVIAARVVGSRVLDIPGETSERGRVSGVSNLSYITLGDLDLNRSMREFQKIRRSRRVTILVSKAFEDLAPNLESLIQQELARGGIQEAQVLFVGSSIASAVANLSKQSDAVLMTLLPQLDTDDYSSLLSAFGRMNLPVFSVGGRLLVQLGALAGWGPADAADEIASRIASNAAQILGGSEAGSLPVELKVNPQLAINIETANAFGIPARDSWQNAMLVMETLGSGAPAPSMAGMTTRTAPTVTRPRTSSEIRRDQARISSEIRRRIFGLRDFSAFDAINPRIAADGRVVLLGYTIKPSVRSDAEQTIRAIDGVTGVDNQIEVLPASRRDNDLRVGVFTAIYGHQTLKKYLPGRTASAGTVGVDSRSLPRGPHPILILVRNGNVALIGQVSSGSHRQIAEKEARKVAGVTSIENYLKVG